MLKSPDKKISISKFLLVSGIFSLFFIFLSGTSHGEPKIWAGKRDYSPETVVSIFGISFGANMELTIKVTRPNGSVVIGDGSFLPGSDTVRTDSRGDFVYQYTLDGIKGDYTAEALYSIGGAEIVLATHVFKDDGGKIETTSAFGSWGDGTGDPIGTKHHFKKGEAIWLVGGELKPSTDLIWKISHKNHLEASGILSTGPTGVITPDPTKLWEIPLDFVIHFDPDEGDSDMEEEKGKYKVRLFKPGKAKAVADEGFTINLSGDPLPDHADAPDPLYPSLHDSKGAWHLDYSKEWLGLNVDGEHDSNQVDADNFDDGVTFDTVFSPGTTTNVSVLISTSGSGAARYDFNDPPTLLYLNGWADWNGDGDWDDDGEKIIGSGSAGGQAKIDPVSFGANSKTFTYQVTPPAVIANTFYTRFRLDRGQDGGLLFVGDGMEQSRGKAFHGEVEDYKVERFIVPVNIVDTTLPDGAVNSAYSYTLNSAGGNSPNTWALLSGALPVGLTLDPSTGEISGTPTTVEVANFTVQVADSSIPTSVSDTRPFTLSIGPPAAAITIVELALPGGIVGAPYTSTLTTLSGTDPNTWSVQSGALPGGLSLNSLTGGFSGTPDTAGTFSFTVQVTDSSVPTPTTDTRAFTIVIDPALVITWGANHSSPVNIFVHLIATANGGSPVYTWSNPGGGLPPGISLDPSTGTLFGTPGTPGSFPFTLKVTDQNLNVTTKSIIWNIFGSAVTLEYSGDAGFGAGDGVEPNTGLSSNVFLFKGIYKNSANLPPDSIGVFIDGGFYAMELLTPCVGPCDFITGVPYQYFAVLEPGIHSYYFFAADGSGDARLPATGDLNNLVVTSSGADPALSFTSDAGYDATDGINPGSGTIATLFSYKVLFEDPDNLPPQTIQVFIDGNLAGENMIPDLTATAAHQDGDFANGEQYVFQTSLNPGDHYYLFSAKDSDGRQVDLAPTSVLNGPSVAGTPQGSTTTGVQVTPGLGMTFEFTGFDATGCATIPEVVVTNSNTGTTSPPAGFLVGTNAFYNLTVSSCATWNSVSVSVHYQDSQFVTSENALRIFHNPLADGSWIDVTQGNLDTAHNIARFQVTSFSEFVLAGDKSTLISLNYFTALGQGNDVLLKWETASEINNVGFNIWKSTEEKGGYSKVNKSILQGKGGPFAGATYRFMDRDNSGAVSFYRLEDISSTGKSTFHTATLMIDKAGQSIVKNSTVVEEKPDDESTGSSGCFIHSLQEGSDSPHRRFSAETALGLALCLIFLISRKVKGTTRKT